MADSEKIVPAYMKVKQESVAKKENKDKKENNPKKEGKNKKLLNKRLILIVLSAIIAIALIIGIIFLAKVIKYSKYNDYAKQMDKYGLSQMYNNSKSTSFESVTKSEAIKIIVSSITNLVDLDNFISIEKEYDNQLWVEYAVENGIISEEQINKKNEGNKITFIEFIEYFSKARVKLVGANLDTSVYPNYSDISQITPEQLYALSDLVATKVLENSNGKINPNKKMHKGEINKLTCDIIKQYNLLIPKGKKFNISEDKIPSNSDKYSYILFDVAKEAYEKDLIVKDEKEFISPIDLFVKERSVYSTISNIVDRYYSIILNIDYETIDKAKMQKELEEYGLFSTQSTILDKYVKYVKDNKIKIKGSGVSQLPIMYYDGENYRIRTKLSFEIISSDTKENILYLDSENNENVIVYDKNKYEFYIDTVIDKTNVSSVIMYVWEGNIYLQKIDEKIDGITLNQKNDEELIIE